jgi:hypothetical protein
VASGGTADARLRIGDARHVLDPFARRQGPQAPDLRAVDAVGGRHEERFGEQAANGARPRLPSRGSARIDELE